MRFTILITILCLGTVSATPCPKMIEHIFPVKDIASIASFIDSPKGAESESEFPDRLLFLFTSSTGKLDVLINQFKNPRRIVNMLGYSWKRNGLGKIRDLDWDKTSLRTIRIILRALGDERRGLGFGRENRDILGLIPRKSVTVTVQREFRRANKNILPGVYTINPAEFIHALQFGNSDVNPDKLMEVHWKTISNEKPSEFAERVWSAFDLLDLERPHLHLHLLFRPKIEKGQEENYAKALVSYIRIVELFFQMKAVILEGVSLQAFERDQISIFQPMTEEMLLKLYSYTFDRLTKNIMDAHNNRGFVSINFGSAYLDKSLIGIELRDISPYDETGLQAKSIDRIYETILTERFLTSAYNYEKSFSGKAPLFPTTERIYINDFDLQLFYDAYGDEDVEAFAMSLLPKPIRDDFENQKEIYFLFYPWDNDLLFENIFEPTAFDRSRFNAIAEIILNPGILNLRVSRFLQEERIISRIAETL